MWVRENPNSWVGFTYAHKSYYYWEVGFMSEWMNLGTGEIVDFKIRKGGVNVGKQVALAKAFIRHFLDVKLWTVGSGELCIEGISEDCQKFGRWLTENEHTWIMVLEEGAKTGHWHMHLLIPGYCDWGSVLDAWEKIRKESGLHVNYVRINNEAQAGSYISKYLRKAWGNSARGFRKFRSSKGISKKLAKELDEIKKERIERMVFIEGGSSTADSKWSGERRTQWKDILSLMSNGD